MSQSSYKALSQTEARNETLDDRISLTETSDEGTTTSQDSLDLVLLEIGHKRKVRRKRRKAKMGGIHNFDGAESYEVSLIDSLPIPKPVPMPRDISTRAKTQKHHSKAEWNGKLLKQSRAWRARRGKQHSHSIERKRRDE